MTTNKTRKMMVAAATSSTSSTSPLIRLRNAASAKKPTQQPTTASPLAASSAAGEFERVFHCFDSDGDGKISPLELCTCMRAAGEELSLEDAEDVVWSVDTDGDGLLGMEDFLRLVGGEEERGRNLRAAFGAYVMEGRGCITAESLKRALQRLGESRTAGECREMIRRFDLDGDGVISFDEFTAMMVVG